jgi:hypothetical protein
MNGGQPERVQDTASDHAALPASRLTCPVCGKFEASLSWRIALGFRPRACPACGAKLRLGDTWLTGPFTVLLPGALPLIVLFFPAPQLVGLGLPPLWAIALSMFVWLVASLLPVTVFGRVRPVERSLWKRHGAQ